MKVIYLLLSILLLAFLAGCGPSQGAATPGATPDPTQEGQEALPEEETLPQPTAAPEGYPAPPAASPTPEGYPGAPTPLPTQDPYPGVESEGLVWIVKPVGVQCEDAGEANLPAAVSELTEADVAVQASETSTLAVCTVCGCPTSEHYRVQIAAADLNKVTEMGWVQEP
jgi:hypothetical protein